MTPRSALARAASSPAPAHAPEPRPRQEEIGAHLEKHKTGVEAVLGALQTMHSKYKFMESNLAENRKQLSARQPDLRANLDVVRMLVAKSAAGGGSGEPFPTYFALADQVHAKAMVAPSGRVCLWMGADVMLEYSYDEALVLLEANCAAAEKALAEAEEDLDFVREQIITIEVRTRAGGGRRQRQRLTTSTRALPYTMLPIATQVNMARVFNFDVEQQRKNKLSAAGTKAA